MAHLDNYRSALLAAFPDYSAATLDGVLDESGQRFAPFIVNHGLGPLWHERTGQDEFKASRLTAEALYLAQEQALREIDKAMHRVGIEHAVFKGAANRLLLHENPAIRACHDLDLLVRPEDRMRTAAALVEAGFIARPNARSISRELVLSRGLVDIDLHWGLLREGRLKVDCTAAMINRRRRSDSIWMLGAEDALLVLLVHPAFAQHLAGWGMGLHRVVDIVRWLKTQSFDWPAVQSALERNGVQTAAWATLRWVQLLTRPLSLPGLEAMMADIQPGRLRRKWLDFWFRNDFSARMAGTHWARLLGLSLFLHDTPRDAARALTGRRRAHRRREADLAAFSGLRG